jgi:hypothetical protein
MSSDAALAFAGLWLTYLIRSSGAYLLLWMLCRLIQNSYTSGFDYTGSFWEGGSQRGWGS